MRAVAIVAALAGMAVGAAGLGSGPAPLVLPPAFAARGSIEIGGDAGFTAANGVRGGSGTADDPFVISDWLIIQTDDESAIRLAGTRAHVVIERVTVPTLLNPGRCVNVPTQLLCANAPLGFIGVHLVDAENVTVRSSRFGTDVGILAAAARHLVVEDVAFGDEAGVDAGIVAVHLAGAQHVRISRLRSEAALSAVDLIDASHVVIEDAEFAATRRSDFGEPNSILWGAADNVTIRNVTLRGGMLDGSAATRAVDVRVEHSRFIGRPGGPLPLAFTFRAPRGVPVDRIVVCGSEFTGYDALVEIAALSTDLRFAGNWFHDNAGRIAILSGATFEGNRFERLGTSIPAIVLTPGRSPHSAHGNAFVDLAVGVAAGADADLRGNWWGDASGPGGLGPGSGTAVRGFTNGGVAPYEPWLAAEPEFVMGCPALG